MHALEQNLGDVGAKVARYPIYQTFEQLLHTLRIHLGSFVKTHTAYLHYKLRS